MNDDQLQSLLQAADQSSDPTGNLPGNLAERVRQEGGDDLTVQVGRAYQLAYNRDPDAEERALAVELVSGHGLFALCRALFNSNEFVMVQ